LNIRIRGLLVACGLAAGLLSAGCRQDMHDQPRFKPYAKSDFFADKRSARPLVDGTVARGHLREDAVLYTGKAAGKPADAFPFPVTADVMARGRERFDIFCSPCHGRTGAGDGMIVQRGYRKPPTFHQDRLRQAAPGYTYDVITNGFGAMPITRSRSRYGTAGPSSPTSRRCSAASTRRPTSCPPRRARPSTPPTNADDSTGQARDHMHDATYTPPASLDPLRQRSLIVGVIGLVAAAAGRSSARASSSMRTCWPTCSGSPQPSAASR